MKSRFVSAIIPSADWYTHRHSMAAQVFLVILILHTGSSAAAFAQNINTATEPLVKFKAVSATKGDYYLILSRGDSGVVAHYSHIRDVNGNPLAYRSGKGKLIRLLNIGTDYGTFRDDSSRIYQVTIRRNSFADLAYLPDLKMAKKLFLNKTVWLKTNSISVNESLTADAEIRGVIGLPAKVTSVGYSSFDFAPQRFYLKLTDGRSGYLDLSVSGTNIIQLEGHKEWDLRENLWLEDLQITRQYAAEIWQLIRTRQIRTGMTQDQVSLALGPPDKVNQFIYRSGIAERWTYENDHHFILNFVLNKLISIKDN